MNNSVQHAVSLPCRPARILFIALFLLLSCLPAIHAQPIARPITTAPTNTLAATNHAAYGTSATDNARTPVNLRPFQIPLPSEHLLRDWLGTRTFLESNGIIPTVTFESDLAGNVSGGRSTGFAEADNLGINLRFDLEKLARLPGSSFIVSMAQRSGSDLSRDRIGNIFTVQQVYGGQTFHLIDAAWQQELLAGRVEIVLGRIAAGDDFLVSQYDYLWQQNAFDGNPVGIFFNAPGMTAYPNATWGARIKFKPTPRSYLMAGVYNGDPAIRGDAYNGANLSMDGPVFVMGEACYQLNGLPGDSRYLGDYKAGFWYDNSEFTDFDTVGYGASPGSKRGSWGLYTLFDQIILPIGAPDSDRGLGIFGSLIVTPDETVAQLPWFFTAGVICRGPLAIRPTDLLGIAVAYGQFGGDLFDAEAREHLTDPLILPQTHESVVELSYRFRFDRNSFFVQPNLQCIINPGGAGQYNDALVLGCQIGINF
jgi:porin